jgi:hypothetical protein
MKGGRLVVPRILPENSSVDFLKKLPQPGVPNLWVPAPAGS